MFASLIIKIQLGELPELSDSRTQNESTCRNMTCFQKCQRRSWIKREYPHSLLKNYLCRAECELYRTLSLAVCERFKIVTWRRTTKSGLIINLLEWKTRYGLFKVVIKLWYELQCSAQVFKRAGCHLKRAL